MENPTQSGASIQDRLMAYLDPAEAPQEEPTTKETEVQTDETPTSDEMQAEPVNEDSEEISEESESEPVSDETQTEEPQLSLSDVASILGTTEDSLDVDDDGNVLVKTKIDGQEGTAKFADVLASYQLRGHVDNKSREVSQLQEQLKTEQAALAQQQAQKLQQADDVMQLAWTELTNEYSSINWEELKQLEPTEYSIKRSDFQDRQVRLQQAYQQLQQSKQEQFQQSQQQILQTINDENQKLIQAVPGWDKPDVAQKEFGDTMSYLKSLGFNDKALYGERDAQGNILIPGVTDHRIIVMARESMLYRALQKSKPEITKKVKIAPKMAKPGQPKSQQEQKAKDLEKRKQNVKSGKRGSVADYLLASGKI